MVATGRVSRPAGSLVSQPSRAPPAATGNAGSGDPSRRSLAGLPDQRAWGASSSPFIRNASASSTAPSPMVTP